MNQTYEVRTPNVGQMSSKPVPGADNAYDLQGREPCTRHGNENIYNFGHSRGWASKEEIFQPPRTKIDVDIYMLNRKPLEYKRVGATEGFHPGGYLRSSGAWVALLKGGLKSGIGFGDK